MTKNYKVQKSRLKTFTIITVSFAIGVLCSGLLAYNTLYVPLRYSQLQSSVLFYERIQNNSLPQIEESLVSVFIPTELCLLNEAVNSPFFMLGNVIDEDLTKAASILGATNLDVNVFCERTANQIKFISKDVK